jgi:hypothetical protein
MVGDVLDEAFTLYKAHWKHLLGVALIYFLVAGTITLVLTILFGQYGAAAAGFVLIFGIFWLTGALVEAIADIRDGRADLTLAETFARVRPRILPLLGASILAGLGIALGLILLIVPGLILLTWWSLITAVIVLEDKGVFESFGRSRELVRGNGWSAFGVIILTALLTSVVAGVISGIFVFLPDYARTYLGNVVGGTVTAPFQALALTVMYFRLAGPPSPAPEPVPELEPR